MKKSVLVLIGLFMLVPIASVPHAQQGRLSSAANEIPPGLTVLTPTAHPTVPRELGQLWLAPNGRSSAARSNAAALGTVAKLAATGDYAKALAAVSQPVVKDGPLGQYATYYAGVAQLRLDRPADALKSFRAVLDQKPTGYLWEAAAIGEAEAHEAQKQASDAVRIYERLLKGRLSNVEEVYMRLGRAAKAAGDSTKAVDAFAHVFYEFPLSENAAIAGSELNGLQGLQPLTAGSARYKVELGRAERLFGSRQYADARTAFETLRPFAKDDDRELIALRLAECDYFTKRTRQARESLRALSATASRKGEATFFYALALRDGGDTQGFVDTLQQVQADFRDQSWAEDALNNLGTYFIRTDEDDRADATFREMYQRYPRGAYAERAAWKIGWTSYRKSNFADTVEVFERAASDFPRSDYRPAWLYWAGRAHDQMGHTPTAQDRYMLAAADYANWSYGRLALKRLSTQATAQVMAAREADRPVSTPQALPANNAVVRALLEAEMYRGRAERAALRTACLG
ncbi:MAG: tetratricopeptide repeat protein [Vicinamibacterales bacterium]